LRPLNRCRGYTASINLAQNKSDRRARSKGQQPTLLTL